MKKQICIPTYNRPEAVDELLSRYAELYKELGFDVHIFDSSDNDWTSIAVGNYAAHDGVFYHRMDSKIHSNRKVYTIYKDFIDEGADYIWVQSDSIRWNEVALRRIVDAIERNEYDLIIPNYRDVEGIGDRIYEDANDFFRDCAWHMTLYGATILRTDVLQHADWPDLEAKYCIDNRINFSHVGLYFEQIAKMGHFKAFHMGLPEYSLTSTFFKKGSGWRREAFFIHCECWPSVISALPSIYKDKTEVIKKQGRCGGDLTIPGLKRLRAERIFNRDIYRKYRNVWKDVSGIPLGVLLLLSIIPPVIAREPVITDRNVRRIKKKIKKFCRNYTHIYLYGCGEKGNTFAFYLETMKISYEGFLISKGKRDKVSLHGKPVKEIDDDLLKDERNGIIFALNELNTKQVLDSMSGKTIRAGILAEDFK